MLDVMVHGPVQSARQTFVVDTGFSGTLLVPETAATELGLLPLGYSEAELADGSVVSLPEYAARIDWMGTTRATWVWTTDGGAALLGTELLDGHTISIDYELRRVEVS